MTKPQAHQAIESVLTSPKMRALVAIANVIEWPIGKLSAVGNTPIIPTDTFEWATHLEAHWKDVLEELKSILMHEDHIPPFQAVSPDQKILTQDQHWKTFFLYGYGHKAEKNCARCPKTTALIESIPGMKTAFFSILSPGKYIPEHRGPYKGVLRYHLGLIVPEPKENCWIRVHDKMTHWETGKSLIFDDTYPHEVWNKTEHQRVVLFVDFLRPLPPWADSINRWILEKISQSRFVLQAKENFLTWEKK